MIWGDFHNISSIEWFFGGLIVKICFVKYRELIFAYFTFCPYIGLLTVSYVGVKNKQLLLALWSHRESRLLSQL